MSFAETCESLRLPGPDSADGSPVRIPAGRYFSADFMALEQHRLWPHVWTVATHLSFIRAPGDYITVSVGRESVVVLRDTDGQVRAFHNTCPHRGMRLCREKNGKHRTIRCGYHKWEWSLDGKLRNAADAESFPVGVPPEHFALEPVRTATWAGFVWICLSPNAPDLREYVGSLWPEVAPYQIDEWTAVQDLTVEIPCNWKTSCDAHNECYHIHTIHPELLALVDDTAAEIKTVGLHSTIRVPFGLPSARRNAKTIPPMLKDLMGQLGIDTANFSGSLEDVRPAIREQFREIRRARGVQTDPSNSLSDDRLTDNHQYYIFPNVQLNFYSERVLMFRHRPHPTNPEHMFFDQQIFEPRRSAEPTASEHRHLGWREGIEPLGPVNGVDVELLPDVQRGMSSGGFRGLYLNSAERPIDQMHRSLDRFLFGETARAYESE